MPPPKPPFPEARKRWFQAWGRKSPKLKEEVGDEITFMEMAQRAGRPVSLAGNSGEGWENEPFAGTGMAYDIVAFAGRIDSNADDVHSQAWA
jgi:hypothetical protein